MSFHASITALPAEPLGRWLMAQRGRADALGRLADAARRDPGFPQDGDYAAISGRLNALQADAEMHEALEQAELDWAAI
ncbi:MAG: hypothetical protein DI610_05360 [Staphylococcus hominis]|nr:MAG: hypothetical protein DI610_05360 [Staphylococcus hominis]